MWVGVVVLAGLTACGVGLGAGLAIVRGWDEGCHLDQEREDCFAACIKEERREKSNSRRISGFSPVIKKTDQQGFRDASNLIHEILEGRLEICDRRCLSEFREST